MHQKNMDNCYQLKRRYSFLRAFFVRNHLDEACLDEKWVSQAQFFYTSHPKKRRLIDGSIAIILSLKKTPRKPRSCSKSSKNFERCLYLRKRIYIEKWIKIDVVINHLWEMLSCGGKAPLSLSFKVTREVRET